MFKVRAHSVRSAGVKCKIAPQTGKSDSDGPGAFNKRVQCFARLIIFAFLFDCYGA